MGMIIYTFALLVSWSTTPSTIPNTPTNDFTENTLCQDDDYLALRELYLNTDGDNWATTVGWPNAAFFYMNPTRPFGINVADWHGVTVNFNGCVTELRLFSNNLNGTIPPELGNMTELESLILNTNQLSGSIPPELGNLFNLETLSLYTNQLSGCYEENLMNLCNQLDPLSNTNNAISFDNTFDASWEDFCNTGAGECGCPPSLFLFGTLPSNTYQVADVIGCDGIVPSGNNVQFKAGQYILLNNNFTVESNADFSAEIEDCDP